MKGRATRPPPDPAPELVAFVRALALETARRDHAAALAASRAAAEGGKLK